MATTTPLPTLPLADWEPTYKTLHRWTQIVGKIRIGLCPPQNHWWHATLRFNARGLSTTLMPIAGSDEQLEIAFDFIAHVLRFSVTDGRQVDLPLEPRSVADMYAAILSTLRGLDIDVTIWPMPVEVPAPVPFTDDHANAAYDREAVGRMWAILARVYGMLDATQQHFDGKASPIHFFWGAFDVALSRFSGRPNPTPPQDPVMGPAYSHEVISHGFWFGGDWPMGGRMEDPIFYTYALPQPEGFDTAAVRPPQARFAKEFGEFILPWNDVAAAEDPAGMVAAFVDSTFAAGRTLGSWPQ